MANVETQAFAEAMDKIRDEMAKTKNPAIAAIGEHMTEVLQANPNAAEAIRAKGKTLTGAFEAMRAEAKKAQTGGCYCMAPEQAWEIVGRYYGIASSGAYAPPSPQGGEGLGRETATEDELSLDALLGDL